MTLRPPGIGGIEFAFDRPVPKGQVLQILSAWRQFRALDPTVFYLVRLEDSDLPPNVPITPGTTGRQCRRRSAQRRDLRTDPFVVTFTVTAAIPVHVLDGPARAGGGVAGAGPGWAIDSAAQGGTGVTAVSVWSHRNPGSGEPGVWHGYATYGANRADVAAGYGEPFRLLGYTGAFALGAGQHYFGVSAWYPGAQAWHTHLRTIYANMPTVPLTVNRPGTGTGGVTASGLSCAGGSTTQRTVWGELSAFLNDVGPRPRS